MTQPSGGQCGYPFRVGEKYVVYAHREGDKKLWASICSRTSHIGEADEDLRYFEGLPAVGSGGRVYGSVNNVMRLLSKNPVIYEPVESVQILLQGQAGQYSAVSDHEGEYQITGLPSGKYAIKVMAPHPFSQRYSERTIQLRAPGCAQADFSLRYDNRISGSIATADGGPASGVEVELRPAEAADVTKYDTRHERITTDALGNYEFRDLSLGRYVVGVGLTWQTRPDAVVYPRTFYPGTALAREATVLHVGPGKHHDLRPLPLPPALRAYQLTGTVVWPDGRPAEGAFVALNNGDTPAVDVGSGMMTDPAGRFSFTIHEGRRYIVRSRHFVAGDPQGTYFRAETAPFIGSERSEPVRLVLAPKPQ